MFNALATITAYPTIETQMSVILIGLVVGIGVVVLYGLGMLMVAAAVTSNPYLLQFKKVRQLRNLIQKIKVLSFIIKSIYITVFSIVIFYLNWSLLISIAVIIHKIMTSIGSF